MKNQKGITLITLAITIVVMMILTFSIAVNIEPYMNQKRKSNFETDIQRLKEEISQYYAREKDIPTINRFTNTTMFDTVKNINDNDEYYVIDLKQLDVDLNYGKDYYTISKKEISEVITDLLDVYIINKQSHTIYYPKGIEYNGKIHYRLPQVFSEIETTGLKASFKFKVGDYVRYSPTLKSFSVSTEETGHSLEQTFSTGDYTGLWQVLYNDSTNGLQLISADSVGELYLNGQVGYNKSLTTLNAFCKNYENETYTITNSGRTVGSDPINPSTDTTQNESLVFNSNTGLLASDTTYTTDLQAMQKATSQNSAGIQSIGKYYWLPSRYVFKTSEVGYFGIYTISTIGEPEYRRMKDIYVNGNEYEYYYSYGVRPVVKLKDEIVVVGGEGTSSSPYQIQ